MSGAPLSQIERIETAIVEFLKPQLPNDVFLGVQPDNPEQFDMAGKGRAALVHFAQSVPSRSAPAAKLQGQMGFAVLCLARSLRGAESGYALLEMVETAMAGAMIGGCREFRVLRSRLEGQLGGLWRWVVEVETEVLRGRIAQPFAPFVPGFGKSEAP